MNRWEMWIRDAGIFLWICGASVGIARWVQPDAPRAYETPAGQSSCTTVTERPFVGNAVIDGSRSVRCYVGVDEALHCGTGNDFYVVGVTQTGVSQ